MEDWLASLSGKGTATGASNPMAVAELLHNSPRGQEWFYQRARQLLDDHSLSTPAKLQLINVLNRAATPSAVALLADMCRTDLPEDLKQAVRLALSQVETTIGTRDPFLKLLPRF